MYDNQPDRKKVDTSRLNGEAENDGGTRILPGIPEDPATDTDSRAVIHVQTPERVRVTFPDNSERVFAPISPNLVIGRRTEKNKSQVDIDLAPFDRDVKGVSRLHAMIAASGNRITIKDLSSTNGTFVNGIQLSPNVEHPVKSGDVVKIGNLKLTLQFE